MMTVNDELERRQKAVNAYFKELLQNLPGGNEENNKNSQNWHQSQEVTS
jgi:hypothetical protein